MVPLALAHDSLPSNGISIGSAFFSWLMVIMNTGIQHTCVCSDSHLVHAVRAKHWQWLIVVCRRLCIDVVNQWFWAVHADNAEHCTQLQCCSGLHIGCHRPVRISQQCHCCQHTGHCADVHWLHLWYVATYTLWSKKDATLLFLEHVGEKWIDCKLEE